MVVALDDRICASSPGLVRPVGRLRLRYYVAARYPLPDLIFAIADGLAGEADSPGEASTLLQSTDGRDRQPHQLDDLGSS
jgi:hypothetical protein